jgi:hypothetical protein
MLEEEEGTPPLGSSPVNTPRQCFAAARYTGVVYSF